MLLLVIRRIAHDFGRRFGPNLGRRLLIGTAWLFGWGNSRQLGVCVPGRIQAVARLHQTLWRETKLCLHGVQKLRQSKLVGNFTYCRPRYGVFYAIVCYKNRTICNCNKQWSLLTSQNTLMFAIIWLDNWKTMDFAERLVFSDEATFYLSG